MQVAAPPLKLILDEFTHSLYLNSPWVEESKIFKIINPYKLNLPLRSLQPFIFCTNKNIMLFALIWLTDKMDSLIGLEWPKIEMVSRRNSRR